MAEILRKVRSALQRDDELTRASDAAKTAAVVRRSNGLKEFTSDWKRTQGLHILDIGQTSSTNLMFITSMGQNISTEDLLRELKNPAYEVATENGKKIDPERFFAGNLTHPADTFDGVLLWDVADYLPEELVKPLVERLSVIVKPGGTVLAYFHTRAATPDAPAYRFHIKDVETLELRPISGLPLQRIFNNRHVENLFKSFRSFKFFLARDNLHEVVIVK